jgi:uncharacterized membrane protein YdbT with pleckstrin-like domain
VAFGALVVPLSLLGLGAQVTHGVLQILAGIAGALLLGVVAVRASRVGVWADPDRVVVQNLWFTHEFNWADVSRIEVWGWRQGLRRSTNWVFRMRDGRGISTSALLPYSGMHQAQYNLLVTVPRGIDYGLGRR